MASGLREKKYARTKQAIYEAAMRPFARKGFHETTVDEIAEAAEVSRATFFNYFGSKEGVLQHYSDLLTEHLTKVADENKSNPSPIARIRLFLQAWLDHVAAHREEARQVYLHSFANPGTLLNQSETRRRLFALVMETVDRGQAEGGLRSDPPCEHLTGLVLSVYHMVVISFLDTGDCLDALADSAWRFVLHGIQATK